jgi:hypothetical protein
MLLLLAACGGGDDAPGGATVTGVPTYDSSVPDTTPIDAGHDGYVAADTSDSGVDAIDVGDACPTSWTATPVVDSTLALPDGGTVLMHTMAAGTQNYRCDVTTGDAGTTYTWTFVGPAAELSDCHGAKVGTHFASDAGPAAPEWMQLDGTYVVGKKVAAETKDSASIPWLLLQETSTGGTGVLSKTQFVHRLNTANGVAPSTGCDASSVGTIKNVAYSADYYFYGP